MEGKSEIISISLKPDTLEDVKNVMKNLNINSRSEIMRLGVKALMSDQKEKMKLKGKIQASFIVVHNHVPKIGKTAHKYQKSIISHLHNHFEKSKCIDIFVLSGEALLIKDFVESVQKTKGVEQSKLVVVS